MCLPDFERFTTISEAEDLTGYRTWRISIKNPIILMSEYQDYEWDNIIEGPHEVKDVNSGIYAYNYNYNNYNYNNYNYSYYYNYNNYNNNNYSYHIAGIIKQYGKVAIHKTGQRSEYAKITKLFTIRRIDAKGPKEFLDWIDKFNQIIAKLASKYQCEMTNWQDFNEKK